MASPAFKFYENPPIRSEVISGEHADGQADSLVIW
jgi:hypothetical protein